MDLTWTILKYDLISIVIVEKILTNTGFILFKAQLWIHVPETGGKRFEWSSF